MPALTDDEKLTRRAHQLHRRGLTQTAIAETLGISRPTVRKLLDPEFAVAEKARLAALEKVRYPIRKNDPDFIEYQAAYNASDRHRELVKEHMRQNRRRKSYEVSE